MGPLSGPRGDKTQRGSFQRALQCSPKRLSSASASNNPVRLLSSGSGLLEAALAEALAERASGLGGLGWIGRVSDAECVRERENL